MLGIALLYFVYHSSWLGITIGASYLPPQDPLKAESTVSQWSIWKCVASSLIQRLFELCTFSPLVQKINRTVEKTFLLCMKTSHFHNLSYFSTSLYSWVPSATPNQIPVKPGFLTPFLILMPPCMLVLASKNREKLNNTGFFSSGKPFDSKVCFIWKYTFIHSSSLWLLPFL